MLTVTRSFISEALKNQSSLISSCWMISYTMPDLSGYFNQESIYAPKQTSQSVLHKLCNILRIRIWKKYNKIQSCSFVRSCSSSASTQPGIEAESKLPITRCTAKPNVTPPPGCATSCLCPATSTSGIKPTKWLSWQHPLGDGKTNFMLIIQPTLKIWRISVQ